MLVSVINLVSLQRPYISNIFFYMDANQLYLVNTIAESLIV